MKKRSVLLLLSLILGLAFPAKADPASLLTSGEPVEDSGFSRGRICLNGVWKFQPATGAADAVPQETAWGAIRVPGTWLTANNFPGIVATGTGGNWDGFKGELVSKGWYEKTFTLPEAWAGRSILLDVRRVSTDAVISVDGQECGRVSWPYGVVDLTPFLKPGTVHHLRILVIATTNRDKVMNLMGVGQNTLVDATLKSRGLIGEVFLLSRPAGSHLDGVWVRTSVRKKELSLEVDVARLTKAGPVKFEASVKDATGTVVKTFSFNGDVVAGESTVVMTWPWIDPKLWDVGQPNLYTLELSAKGEGLDSGLRQVFGFREAWVDGRTIYLNGSPFRLRPTSSLPEGEFRTSVGTEKVLESAMDGILGAGFNCLELWPFDMTVRGTYDFRDLTCEIADRKGLPVEGPILFMGEVLGSWDKIGWDDPKIREDWERRLRLEWKKYRNNPSIFMWSSSGNIGGHTDDQDPRLIGHALSDPAWASAAKVAGWWHYTTSIDVILKEVKKMDPRPLMIHQGGPMSDVYGINNYLDLTPLQEREEWLSDWSQNGTMPYCAVEFGTPLSTTMNRGRDGFMFSSTTEWLMTEFCASYLGSESYRLEQADYRHEITSKYKSGQLWEWPQIEIMNYAPAFQKLQELFITNTWRSWRTMGITAGIIPWGDAHGFRYLTDNVDLPPFQPGQRGTQFPRVSKQYLNVFGDPGSEILPAGKALIAGNGPTLAWICGPTLPGDPSDFTAKDHSFLSGAKIAKRIALINDSRSEQPWTARVSAQLNGKSFGPALEKSGRIRVGETLFIPVEFTLPKVAKGKQSGEFTLAATVGGIAHSDQFPFHVFAPAQPETGTVKIFDPAGETAAWLKAIGVKAEPWDGGKAEVVVIGRKALSPGASLPGDLEAYVQAGGRLLIMAQDPDWMRDRMGLRVGHLMCRRVFGIDPGHPVVAGLDDLDLRDWSGHSTLLEARPHYDKPDVSRLSNNMPTWGWRWGGRGTVVSAPIEKPHCSGWRPLLECEFDLAYSPLLELDLGRGRVTLCTFDLEDHVKLDPAADRLARNIVSWVKTAPLSPRSGPALYVGGDEGAGLLDLVGCEYRRATSVEATAPLVILGPDVSADVATPVLEKGGKVVVLPRRSVGPAGLGVSVAAKASFTGSLTVPNWQEARGLSASDLRWRVEGSALLLDGAETGADGLIARVKQGSGEAIFTQSDPAAVPADQKAYFRFTRWRLTRTLAQEIANLGGSFSSDSRVLHVGVDQISIAGKWKAAWTNKQPATAKGLTDSGVSAEALAQIKPGANEGVMEEVDLPGRWPKMMEGRGEVVFLRQVTIPTSLVGKDLTINLGPINGLDTVYVNGTSIGSTEAATRNYWTVDRVYSVPASLLKAGENTLAIRLFDDHGGGNIGMTGKDLQMGLPSKKPVNLYHPDYRTDFVLGDDPYRYFRW